MSKKFLSLVLAFAMLLGLFQSVSLFRRFSAPAFGNLRILLYLNRMDRAFLGTRFLITAKLY